MISGSEKSKIFGDKWHKMGLQTIKMEWDLCSSPPCIPFYPYTMFQNPMPKPSCQKFRKTFITEKVLVTQSSDIVYCDLNTRKTCLCRFSSLLEYFFPVQIDVFFSFCVWRSSVNWHKFHILAYPKTSLCRFSSLLEHFSPVQIEVFSFCVGGVQ